MQNYSILDIIKTTLSKTKVEELASIASNETYSASNETYSVKDLIDLSFHNDVQIGFRAAWILENVYSNHQERFLPFAIYFLNNFTKQHNQSALRHYVKILAFMTRKNAAPEIKEIIADYSTDQLVETVFSWLINEKIPVAVKSHCLNILANLSIKHSWIRDELIQTMDYLIDKESIAFFAKVKQIRKQLSVFS